MIYTMRSLSANKYSQLHYFLAISPLSIFAFLGHHPSALMAVHCWFCRFVLFNIWPFLATCNCDGEIEVLMPCIGHLAHEPRD